MPPTTIPPSSPSNQPPSTSILNPNWCLSNLSVALSILAIIFILFLRHLLLQNLIKPPPKSTNPSSLSHSPLPPAITKSPTSYPAPAPPPPPPPPFPIPTIRRHSYPLTLTADNTLAPSTLPTTNIPPAKSKRGPGGPRRPGGMIRRDTKEETNGCRRHVIVFEKNPG